MTATPGGHDDSDQTDQTDQTGDPVTDEAAPPAREPDLARVGDNHMPQDLREAEREAGARSRERAAEDRASDRTDRETPED